MLNSLQAIFRIGVLVVQSHLLGQSELHSDVLSDFTCMERDTDAMTINGFLHDELC